MKALAKHPYGLVRKQITKAVAISGGGTLTRQLEILESAGFINLFKRTGKQSEDCSTFLETFEGFIDSSHKLRSSPRGDQECRPQVEP